MNKSGSFKRFIIIPLILLLGIMTTVVFMVVYTLTIRTQDGRMISSRWPRDFTVDFARYLTCEGEYISIEEQGRKLLQENHVWLQVLNENGNELLAFDKPAEIPKSYKPYELLTTYQYGQGSYCVFLSSIERNEQNYIYLIGFSIPLSKVTMYVDQDRYVNGRGWMIFTISLTGILVISLTIYNGVTSVRDEKRRRQDEQARREWLANITHDLKTPLVPIRGYAEILASDETLDAKQMKSYGDIILKNTLYTTQLVEDLKLTYQLQSNMLPVHKEKTNPVRLVREIVIDILNTPEYEKRQLEFMAEEEELTCNLDPQLLRRALLNIIMNALKYNTKDCSITVEVQKQEALQIVVTDNGRGMTKEELQGLFHRYYRGTNTEEKPEGSGLGMAIAKQIVEAQGGEIHAESKEGKGTKVTIRLGWN